MAPNSTGSGNSGAGCACDKEMPGAGQLKLRPSTAGGQPVTGDNSNTPTTSKTTAPAAANTTPGLNHLQLRPTNSLAHVASASPGPPPDQAGHTTSPQTPNTKTAPTTTIPQTQIATKPTNTTTYKTTHPNTSGYKSASLTPSGQPSNSLHPQTTLHRFGTPSTGTRSHSSHTTRVGHTRTSYRPARTASRPR